MRRIDASPFSARFQPRKPASGGGARKAPAAGKAKKRFPWLKLGLVSLATAGMLWFFRYGPPTPIDTGLMFDGRGTLALEDGRSLYRDSLKALFDQDPEGALAGFLKLEPHYPGLGELVLLHQAEALAALGREAEAQAKLNTLMSRFADSPLKSRARYLLGQSHVRAGETEAARRVFEALNRDLPEQKYGIGSLYYLGLLDEKSRPDAAVSHWSRYLAQCPDCIFSGDIANGLETLDRAPTPERHGLMGEAYVASGRAWDKALTHLKQAPAERFWLPLAQAQLENRQADQARQTLIAGLKGNTDPKKAVTGIDLLLKHSPDAKTALASLGELPAGQDYVLWRLAQQAPEQSEALYRQLVTRFAQSDYAPESAWNLMWRHWQAGRKAQAIEAGRAHLSRYAYARSAPKVLFWLGKAQEANQPTEARKAYQQIISRHPDAYYALRAQGRLVALDGGVDPRWLLQPRRAAYPPAFDLSKIKLTGDSARFREAYARALGHGQGAERVERAIGELQQAGASDDVLLLANEIFGEGELAYAAGSLSSWAYHSRGEYQKALKTLRDSLQAEAMATRQVRVPSEDELRLLHPVYYGALIAENSRRQGIDPYLIQALMREESHFNPLAVSSSNARGLMQLLPTTAAEVAQWEGLPGFSTLSLFQPEVNIRLGSRYLNYLSARFTDLPPAIAPMAMTGAYNGGPNAMRRWISQRSPLAGDADAFVENIPYEQSRDYIKKVYASWWNYQRLYGR